MRSTIIRLATASAPLPLTLSQASASLVPPIPLYRRLLRSHRNLPVEMRYLGDSYVKSEFRLTRSTDNPLHIIAFLSQWKMYLDELESSTEVVQEDSEISGKGKRKQVVNFRGRKLEPEMLDRFSPEQLGQLYELMHATKDVWKTSEQLEAEASTAEHSDKASLAGSFSQTSGDGDPSGDSSR